jgi:hypothetical protein
MDRIRRIEQRWHLAAAKIRSSLQAIMKSGPVGAPVIKLYNGRVGPGTVDLLQLKAETFRQDRLMRLVLAAYQRDIGRIQSVEGRASTSQQDLSLIAEQLVKLDQKAAALRDSVARVLAMNAELELQLKQAHTQATRLDQARLAALGWSDTLRAELDRKSEALRLAHAELAARTADLSAASANPQPS